jgi:UDP-N-acetylmuramoylalanine--D-glutamate ligase
MTHVPNFVGKVRATTSPQERTIRPRPSRKISKLFSKISNKNLELLWQNWYGVKILVLGFGKEGIDTFRFLRRVFPKKVIGIGDRNQNVKAQMSNVKKVRWHLGKNYLKTIKNYDVVIKSPGVSPKVIAPYLQRKSSSAKGYGGQRITSQTEIFFENCPGKIIGITGTKGKSTTTFLIYEILKEGGLRAHLVGNIGKPVLNLLLSATPKDVYVYELSSHQLHNIKKSPHIAVLLNIYPEHLDYYKNFNGYKNAKANIARHQKKNDFLLFNAKDKEVSQIAKKSKAKKIPIKGEYYSLDREAARAVGKIFKIPSQKIEKAIRDFKGLPHRLEYVGAFKGIKFYNDALSTIPETTIAALNLLGNKVETIFLGGFDRGLSFKNLAKKILRSKIKTIILFPTTGEKIWNTFRVAEFPPHRTRSGAGLGQGKKLPKHFFVDNMRDAVKLAYKHTGNGKICLLSCASPSFSIFKDYKEKGNLFKRYVNLYGKK